MTYNEFMDWLFDWCVYVLEVSAQYVGMTYNEINIWVFVIIEPVVFVLMAYYILRLRHRLKTYQRDYPEPQLVSAQLRQQRT